MVDIPQTRDSFSLLTAEILRRAARRQIQLYLVAAILGSVFVFGGVDRQTWRTKSTWFGAMTPFSVWCALPMATVGWASLCYEGCAVAFPGPSRRRLKKLDALLREKRLAPREHELMKKDLLGLLDRDIAKRELDRFTKWLGSPPAGAAKERIEAVRQLSRQYIESING